MTRWPMISLMFAALLVAAPRAGSAQMAHEGAPTLEEVMAESASTPAQHKALAAYYRAEAEKQRKLAAEHRSMGKAYGGSLKQVMLEKSKEHCNHLVELSDKMAAEYDGLAKIHEEAAAAK